MFKDSLFLITARAGSKGIPNKNIIDLNGKPLIYYTLEAAMSLVTNNQICISTDSQEIIDIVSQKGIIVPFIRPSNLSLDNTGSYEVIMHALDYYKKVGKFYKNVVLLQPTSPFRTSSHIISAFEEFNYEIDMVVSVNLCKNNPFYNLFQENNTGYLSKFNNEFNINRQSRPEYYEFNGAIYIYNTTSLEKGIPFNFKKMKKYLMDSFSSVDIDTFEDLLWAEFLLKNKKVIL